MQCRQELLIVVDDGLDVSDSPAAGTIQIFEGKP